MVTPFVPFVIFLPMMIAGHETLVLAIGGAGVLALGVWFLAHRHGQLKGMVDANQDGIDDRVEAIDKENVRRVIRRQT